MNQGTVFQGLMEMEIQRKTCVLFSFIVSLINYYWAHQKFFTVLARCWLFSIDGVFGKLNNGK